ncbi:hypothetical protein GJ496_011921 [Pomphorhynchus laevis]|nr:hypothetical protein GJ496_011921 [Pomphorhynchus laevis]
MHNNPDYKSSYSDRLLTDLYVQQQLQNQDLNKFHLWTTDQYCDNNQPPPELLLIKTATNERKVYATSRINDTKRRRRHSTWCNRTSQCLQHHDQQLSKYVQPAVLCANKSSRRMSNGNSGDGISSLFTVKTKRKYSGYRSNDGNGGVVRNINNVNRRNERERRRVKTINEGFQKLSECLPYSLFDDGIFNNKSSIVLDNSNCGIAVVDYNISSNDIFSNRQQQITKRSKVETLYAAISYIQYLANIIEQHDQLLFINNQFMNKLEEQQLEASRQMVHYNNRTQDVGTLESALNLCIQKPYLSSSLCI